ncbi:MAG: sensor histidine kinase [Sphaerochaeta sp.]|uniref:cache domain-containing sensor histidine kinase n=1 Tax=Sphaerochaeta sp. TaxID=1972642 RepID=UPI003D0E91B0
MNARPVFKSRTTLFGRLLLYFLVVLIVPLGLFSAYYALIGGRNQERYLKNQTLNLVLNDADQVSTVLETYRHKAYQLSTDPLVVSILRTDRLSSDSPESRFLYQLLFSTMRGDTYLASANLVSNSGKVRISTHTFPEVYDLRYHGNTWDMNSIISQNEDVSPTASLISIRGHRTADNGKQVVASILRRVYDEDGTNLGYLVLDLYAEALSGQVNQDQLLDDLLLVDTKEFYATSLLQSDDYGTFDKFPFLSELKGNYRQAALRTGTSITAISQIPGTSLYLAGSVNAVPFEESLDRWFFAFSITMLIGTFLALVLSLLFSRSISRPIRDLAHRMGEVEDGKLQSKEVTSAISEFAKLEHSFNLMVRQIASLLELTREEQQKLSEAERKALESQMNPHFLFNTLNTIKALAKLHGEQEIYTITVKLGKLLRSTIDNHESESTLEESMNLIDSYLTIQKLRFGDKLVTDVFLDPSCASVKTPKLIIQPLVENAIIHGLEPKRGEWRVTVRVERHEGRIFITVQDNGVGFPPGTLPDNLDELANSTHVGVYNIYRRLLLKYGRKMHLSIDSKTGEGTTVRISFPDDASDAKGVTNEL